MLKDVNVTAEKTPIPPESDFAFEIDFQRGVGPASRVFAASLEFTKACEVLDCALIRSIDTNIETVLVLEDIKVGSITTCFRNVLSAIEDEALKKLDWRLLVGNYLVLAKYRLINWLDNRIESENMSDLCREIQEIAAKTDVRYLPDYLPPKASDLIEFFRNVQSVKTKLLPGDKARFLSEEGNIELDLTAPISLQEIDSLAVAKIAVGPTLEMILAVKKPDYLGTSKWQLLHAKRLISAKMEDANWLEQFQARLIDVRPGDSLLCLVQIETSYGFDNEIISERFTITEVKEVLRDRFETLELPFDKRGKSKKS